MEETDNKELYVEFGTERKSYKVMLPPSKTKQRGITDFIGKEVILGIRPEHISDDPEVVEKATNGVIECDVEVTEMMGVETYLYLTFLGNSITARVAPTSQTREGDKIKVALDVEKMHIFDKETEKAIVH